MLIAIGSPPSTSRTNGSHERLQRHRDAALRFSNGHFAMIGLRVDGKPLLRACSIVSANYEDHLEFLSVKVPEGPLTSRLQHIREGDTITGDFVIERAFAEQ